MISQLIKRLRAPTGAISWLSGATRCGLVVVLGAWITGCAILHGRLPERADVPNPIQSLRAGAATIDITPGPGFPMAGHSLSGKVSRGVWLRLRARAIYFEDERGASVALVACDLWAVPAGLADRVVDILDRDHRRELGERRLGREQVVISASHTHQSPGLYSSNPFFSMFAAPRAGFDPELHEFLARRIAYVIARAVANAEKVEVSLRSERVAGLFRNRSMLPFRENAEADEVIADSGMRPCAAERLYPDPDSCRAVDARIRVLRLQRAATGELLAAAVFMAVHPTALTHDLELYSSDFFGAVASEAEAKLSKGRMGSPVVAVFNGAEGDVSLRWTTQSRADLARLSTIAADAVERLSVGGGEELEGGIQVAFADRERLWLRRAGDGLTAAFPMPGRATAAGAEDGPSGLPSWLAREGMPSLFPTPLHGAKVGAVDFISIGGVPVPPFWFTRIALSLVPPPRRVELAVVDIAGLRFVTLPGEFTTVLGRRIADTVGGKRDPNHVVLLGLAQNYVQYFTTPEEYALQHYEGASMLYGPHAGVFVQERLRALARSIPESPEVTGRRSYFYIPWFADWMQLERTALQRVAVSPETVDAGLEPVLASMADDAKLESFPRTCWNQPSDPLDEEVDIDTFMVPRVRIDVRSGNAWELFDDDAASLRLLTVAGRGQAEQPDERWCSYWIPPRDIDRSAKYRFRHSFRAGAWQNGATFELPSR